MGASTRALDAFLALCLARFREFYRESEAVFWGFAFPIMLSVGLGIAFRNRPAETLPVAVLEGPQAARVSRVAGQTPLLKASVMDAESATRALRTRARWPSWSPRAPTAAWSTVSIRPAPESAIARARVDDALQRAAGRRDPVTSAVVEVARARRPLHRLPDPRHRRHEHHERRACGASASSSSTCASSSSSSASSPRHAPAGLPGRQSWPCARVFMVIEVSFVLGFARLAFGVPVRGSARCRARGGRAGRALLRRPRPAGGVARAHAWRRSTGLMNVVMMPMFVLSGIFFSADRFPEVLQPLIRVLPLTALNDAHARGGPGRLAPVVPLGPSGRPRLSGPS